LPNAATSGITSLTVPPASRSTAISPDGKAWLSWSSVYVPAGTIGSNSPWIMLCAR
jgi:hypothetical protein